MSIRVFSAVAGALMVIGSVGAQTVYVASSNGQLGQLNVLTGAYSLIGFPNVELGGIGFGLGGGLYGLGIDDSLYSVSPTGVETLVGPTSVSFGGGWGLGGAPNGLLFAQGGMLLSSISQTTGAATLIGMTGFATGAVPVLDASGNLYLNDTFTSQLYSVSTTDASSTLIGSLSTASQVDAMVWVAGQMYAIDLGGDIYSVDPSTAATTLVATYSVGNDGSIFAAASDYSAVPEPKSFAVLGLGALAFLKRKKRS